MCVYEGKREGEKEREIVKDEKDRRRDVDVLRAPLSLAGWVSKCRKEGEMECVCILKEVREEKKNAFPLISSPLPSSIPTFLLSLLLQAHLLPLICVLSHHTDTKAQNIHKHMCVCAHLSLSL